MLFRSCHNICSRLFETYQKQRNWNWSKDIFWNSVDTLRCPRWSLHKGMRGKVALKYREVSTCFKNTKFCFSRRRSVLSPAPTSTCLTNVLVRQKKFWGKKKEFSTIQLSLSLWFSLQQNPEVCRRRAIKLQISVNIR